MFSFTKNDIIVSVLADLMEGRLSNLKRISCYVFALLLFMQSFLIFSPAKAELTPPVPSDWGVTNFSYTYASGKITEKFDFRPTETSAYTQKELSYTNPVKASYESLGAASGLHTNPEGGGYLMFKAPELENLYLAVEVSTQNAFGFFIKPDETTNYAQVYVDLSNSEQNVIASTSQGNKNLTVTIVMKGAIAGMGAQGPWAVSGRPGVVKVAGLVPTQIVQGSPKLCLQVLANVTGSKFFSKLPEAKRNQISAAITANKWPSALSGSAKFYLEYNVAGVWTRASFAGTNSTGSFIEKANNEGKVEMTLTQSKNYPIGKYRITGVFYIRYNEADADSEARIDTPGQGSWQDFMDNRRQIENSIEVFNIPTFEMNLVASGNTGEGISSCKSLTFVPRDIIDAGGQFIGADAGKTVCDGLQGGFIVVMLKQAFCGLLLITKQWADTAYNASMQLLATSIGVATDVTAVPTTDSADTINVGPNKASDQTASSGDPAPPGDPGGGENPPTDGDSSGDTARVYHATATSCSPEPCFDQSWNYHGSMVINAIGKATALCKQQRENPAITRARWNAGMCLAPSTFKIENCKDGRSCTVNVTSKENDNHTGTPPTLNPQDYCGQGGLWVSMTSDCSTWFRTDYPGVRPFNW